MTDEKQNTMLLERLVGGARAALRRPPQGNGPRLLVQMRAAETQQEAHFSQPARAVYALSEPGVVQGQVEYEMFDCQTCTLYLALRPPTKLPASDQPQDVRVRLVDAAGQLTLEVQS
jgi:hypothetical protein